MEKTQKELLEEEQEKSSKAVAKILEVFKRNGRGISPKVMADVINPIWKSGMLKDEHLEAVKELVEKFQVPVYAQLIAKIKSEATSCLAANF